MSDLLVTMKRDELAELVRSAVEEAVLSASEQNREPELLTCGELARRIKRHPHRLTKWVKDNGIPRVYLTPTEMRFVWDDVVGRLKEIGFVIDKSGGEGGNS